MTTWKRLRARRCARRYTTIQDDTRRYKTIYDDTRRYKTIQDDIRRWRERPPEHITRHNSGHNNDEHNSGHNDNEHNSGHNYGGNDHRRAYQNTGMTSTAEGHQRLASISILPVCTTITIIAPQGR